MTITNQIRGYQLHEVRLDESLMTPFYRQKVAEPYTLFASKFIGQDLPLFWDIVTISGGTSTYSDSTIEMEVASAGDIVIRQTFEHFNYQSGKGQTAIIAAELTLETDVSKMLGYYSSGTSSPYNTNYDGCYWSNNGIVVYANVAKDGVINSVEQSDWNYDKMDGTGPSGLTVDWSKGQVFVIDFEWLGYGTVRFGIFIGGIHYLVHKFEHANYFTGTYSLSPNQPLRLEIRSTGGAGILTSGSTAVLSEGQEQDTGIARSFVRSDKLDANTVGVTYAGIGIRMKSDFHDSRISLGSFSAFTSTLTDVAQYEIRLNPTISGVFTYNDQTNSPVQVAEGDTDNVVTGGTILNAGILAPQIPLEVVQILRSPGTAIDGTLDEIVLCFTPLIGNNQDIYHTLTWKELF